MKILVIGGMHGNEPLGIALVKKLQKENIKNIDAVFANEKAIQKNVRFIKTDLNRSFPGKEKGSYEMKRAKELIDLCKNYDLVLDFHNTHCPKNDCSFIGENSNSTLINVSSYFKLKRIIIADYDCLNKYAPNCISIEISLTSQEMDNDIWIKRLKKLADLDLKNLKKKGNVQTYKFVYRMTLEDKERLQLQSQNVKAFRKIKSKLAKAMGVKSPAYPIFINDAYTPYNYGGLLNKE